MSDPESRPGEKVTISVERMMRFCLLAQMQSEYADSDTKALPLHLTRFGTLLLETSESFLYSLFEDRPDSLNLLIVWRDFDHPFGNELQDCLTRLSPFKEELKLVRNRLGFHESLSRSHERAGLGIFHVDSGRARDFARLVIETQQLFLRIIAWYMKRMDSSFCPTEMWNEFVSELRGAVREQLSMQFLANVTLDHDLVFEFFLTFGRFEYALKAAGFVVGDLQTAKPDWSTFGRSLDFGSARLDHNCATAIDYFGLHPPWRQVLTPDALAWDSTVGFARLERMDQVLDLVRRVRNNLFHGGKFNDEVHSGQGRNGLLLRHSIAILHRSLELSPLVAASYNTAAL